MKAIGLIADIVASRDIPDRRKFQIDLGKSLDRVTKDAGAALLSPYTITLGDEFQAVYRESERVFRDLIFILLATYPTKIRFALGHDALLTEINPKAAIGMDGPAFGKARALLTRMKSIDRTMIQIAPTSPRTPDLKNASLRVFSNVIDNWNRTAVGALFSLLDGRSVDEMAELLAVKKRTIYKAIKTHHIRDLVDLLHCIEALPGAEASRSDDD